MFVGEEEGLGVLIVDGAGKVVARAHGVRMLAPGYSLRRGAKGGPMNPVAAAKMAANYQRYMKKHPGLTGWDRFGPQSYYQVGQLPMDVVAEDALRSSSGVSGDGMFGWKYGGQASYTVGQLPANIVARDAIRSSSGRLSGDEGMFGQIPSRMPVNAIVKDALRSSSAHGASLSGDGEDMEGIADMFGPEGEPSSLF
jgi:hypothetical protein